MDIVARLNSFINQLGMPITQVADSCGIPRPSMTQLLKGRNQKISDDVLRKLHVRFPRLNICGCWVAREICCLMEIMKPQRLKQGMK